MYDSLGGRRIACRSEPGSGLEAAAAAVVVVAMVVVVMVVAMV